MKVASRNVAVATAIIVAAASGLPAAGPAFVDITWMSVSNMYYELGPLHIVTDGYITRLPQGDFFGGGGGYAETRRPFTPDVAAVTRVMNALGKPSRVNLLLTGHSHWDHSFDTATWSKLTGAASSDRRRRACRRRPRACPPSAAVRFTAAKSFRSPTASPCG